MRRHRSQALVAAATLGFFTSGCMPSYDYEPRMIPSTPRSHEDRCYQDRRVELVSGEANWTYSTGGYYYTTYHYNTARGVAFYQAGQRVDAAEAVRRLGDAQLTKAYTERLDETASAATMYPFWRSTTFLVAGAGIGLALLALGQTLARTPDERVEQGIPSTLWIGTGLALASIIPAIFMGVTYKKAVAHHRSERIFSEPSLVPRLEDAARAHNRRVAADCGTTPDPELPMSPSLKK